MRCNQNDEEAAVLLQVGPDEMSLHGVGAAAEVERYTVREGFELVPGERCLLTRRHWPCWIGRLFRRSAFPDALKRSLLTLKVLMHHRAGGLAALLAIVGALAASGCSGNGNGGQHLSFLDPQGPIAAAQRHHFFEVLALMLIVVLPVLVCTPLFAWRYRHGNTASRYTPKWSFWWPIEIAVWGVPIAIAALLAVLLYRSTAALDPYLPLASDRPALRVQVIGYDWKWLFVYPDLGIATVGELAFPAARPLALELTSATVMQSFAIPPLGSQMYAMGGMTSRLHLAADRPGRFQGENTLFNGRGFHLQKFSAVALSPEDFDGWVERVRSGGVVLDARGRQVLSQRGDVAELRAALAGAQPAMPDGVVYFKGVSDRLFRDVVEATMHGTPSLRSAYGAAGTDICSAPDLAAAGTDPDPMRMFSAVAATSMTPPPPWLSTPGPARSGATP